MRTLQGELQRNRVPLHLGLANKSIHTALDLEISQITSIQGWLIPYRCLPPFLPRPIR